MEVGKNRTHRAFSLSLFWQHLNSVFLERSGLKKAIGNDVIFCDHTMTGKKERQYGDARATSEGIDFYPGQHFIMPVFDFKEERPQAIPFWVLVDGEYEVNKKYIEAVQKQKMRELSGGSLFPSDDIKKIFIDENGVIISDLDLSELENPDSFIAKQKQMMKERLDA